MGARFVITLVPMRGVDGVRALRWLLKRARRQFGLVAVDVREESKPDATTVAAREGGSRHADHAYLAADGDDHAES
jgi:hypothetical protein